MESHDRIRSREIDQPTSPWWALDEICERIVRVQHAALRQTVTSLLEQLAALAGRHGDRAPVLIDVLASFDTVTTTLLSHLAKEENILFPAFASLAAAWREGKSAPPLPFPTVRHPIALMEAEHDRLERELARLHEITGSLTLPDRVSREWAVCHAAILRFERDLQADTHLEDGTLFPRALALERALL